MANNILRQVIFEAETKRDYVSANQLDSLGVPLNAAIAGVDVTKIANTTQIPNYERQVEVATSDYLIFCTNANASLDVNKLVQKVAVKVNKNRQEKVFNQSNYSRSYFDKNKYNYWEQGNQIIMLASGGAFLGGLIGQVPGAVIGAVIAAIYGSVVRIATN